MSDEIKIERQELFDRSVDEALAKERAGRERIVASAPPVSPVRRLLLNPLFHMPLAALIGVLSTYMMLEPKIDDVASVRGEVVLVNADPFDAPSGGIAFTVGSTSVYVVDPGRIRLEPGAQGQRAFTSIDEITVGTKIEAAGETDGTRLFAGAIRPNDGPPKSGAAQAQWPLFVLFPLTALLMALGLLIAEGLTTRNWLRMLERSIIGSVLAALFAVLAFVPVGLLLTIGNAVLESEFRKHTEGSFVTIRDISASSFLLFAACRSAAWACIGAATGVGMNIARSTRQQLRNSVLGGALGGAFGGLFFDPIDRWGGSTLFDGAATSRLVGLVAVGFAIGIFVALVERLARDAWLRVRTGPLAGKSFILYKTPTSTRPTCRSIGSARPTRSRTWAAGWVRPSAAAASGGDAWHLEIRSSSEARSSISRSGRKRAGPDRSSHGGSAIPEGELEAAEQAVWLVPGRPAAR
jgi:hypothetical protein